MEEQDISKKGTVYELKNFRGGGVQFLRFNEKLEDGSFVDGTTNEQVVHVLIKRLIQQNKKNPDVLTQQAIDFLKQGQEKLKERTKEVRQKKFKYNGGS